MALTGIQIFKLLPKTNCKECGEPTCMVFATLVAEGGKEASDCPTLINENRKKLKAYLEPFRSDI